MSRKTQQCYENVFQYINDNLISLKCKSFMSDYESAMRNAIQKYSGESKMYACWFHFARACRRYASGLTNFLIQLRKDEKLRKIFNKFLSIPLLPSENIFQAFMIISEEANKKNSEMFAPFIKYFRKQWIMKVS